MRENTRRLMADPRFSLVQTPLGLWGQLRAQSPREVIAIAREYARTDNEASWDQDSNWLGLGTQPRRDVDSSGIARHPQELMQSAVAKLQRPRSKPGSIRPHVCGGSWSVPAVLANLPLAARVRVRDRLPPVNIHLVCAWSASVSQSQLAPIFAKLARGIWDYTLAGGVVTLKTSTIGFVRRQSTGAKGLILTATVPMNDLGQLSLGLSVAMFRAVSAPLVSAFSDSRNDSIRAPQSTDNPLPGTIYIGGRTSNGRLPELDAPLKALGVE